ncbi:MAG: C-GCAxxG-C-C family protein, partial [Rikenellaceae bacterium]
MLVNIEERATKAMELFTKGYNCSQSVVMAYSDFLDVDNDLLATISAPFGGGMGRLREVC